MTAPGYLFLLFNASCHPRVPRSYYDGSHACDGGVLMMLSIIFCWFCSMPTYSKMRLFKNKVFLRAIVLIIWQQIETMYCGQKYRQNESQFRAVFRHFLMRQQMVEEDWDVWQRWESVRWHRPRTCYFINNQKRWKHSALDYTGNNKRTKSNIIVTSSAFPHSVFPCSDEWGRWNMKQSNDLNLSRTQRSINMRWNLRRTTWCKLKPFVTPTETIITKIMFPRCFWVGWAMINQHVAKRNPMQNYFLAFG